MNETRTHRHIRRVIRSHLKAQLEAGIIWTVTLVAGAFALGVFIGRLAFT